MVVIGEGQDERHRLDREVAAADEPLVVLLGQQRAGEPDHGLVVGEDPDDVGAAADLLVDPLQRVGGPQLGPVLRGQQVERDQVLLGVPRAARRPSAPPSLEPLEHVRDPARRASSWSSALNTSLSAAATRPR